MGYETRIHVVAEYGFDTGTDYKVGEELAVLSLSKCGHGPLEELMARYRKKPGEGSRPSFALYAREPDRQQEMAEFLYDLSRVATELPADTEQASYLRELGMAIEDGVITTDKYGDYLAVIPLDEFLAALNEELKENNYRRFQWARVLLEVIARTWTENDRCRLKVVTYGY